jgi:hypothetical protein
LVLPELLHESSCPPHTDSEPYDRFVRRWIPNRVWGLYAGRRHDPAC